MNVAARYGTPIEVAQSARNFTLPFGGGIGKGGISFGAETPLRPGQATKGMDFMQRLRAGQYPNSATAQRLLRTGATAAPRLGILGALSSLGGQAAAGLPLAYTYGASKLQESLPMSLIGEGGLSDQNPYFGAMGVSVDPTVEEILRYGDEGKPSPDTGEGSTLAGIWDAIKNEFGGSAEAADLSDMIPKNLEKTIEEGMRSYRESNEISPALRKAIEEGTSYNEWDMIPNTKYHSLPMKRISLNQDSVPINRFGKTIGPLANEEEEQYYTTGERIPRPNRWQQFLSKYTRQPFRPATSYTRNYTPVQLNRMNALGGWYSEPARQQRRDRRSVSTLLARKAAAEAGQGTWTTASQKNLNLKTMGSRPGHYDRPGGNGGVQGTSTPATPGGWHPGAAKGGLATLWPR